MSENYIFPAFRFLCKCLPKFHPRPYGADRKTIFHRVCLTVWFPPLRPEAVHDDGYEHGRGVSRFSIPGAGVGSSEKECSSDTRHASLRPMQEVSEKTLFLPLPSKQPTGWRLIGPLCLRGNRKKIRCTGAQPCEICIRADTTCTYNASYARGRRPSVPDTTSSAGGGLVPSAVHGYTPSGGDTLVGSGLTTIGGDDMGQEAMDDAPGEILDNGSTAPPPSHRSRAGQGEPPNRVLGTVFAQPAPSSRTSPEPSQTDRQGHYVGPASGVSFLLRVQKRLHQTLAFSKTSSIFTFGDAPLPDFDPSFFVLPQRDEAQRLVDRYFDFAVPTHRFLHRPTVNAWLDEFYETMGTMRSKDDAPARTALLLMVFAQAREYTPCASGLVNDVR